MATVAVLATGAVLLTGCASAQREARGPEPLALSQPTDERVEPGLWRFYRQQIAWYDCEDGLQCGEAKVPLDWDRPREGSISLSLVRRPATGERWGSMLTNPGGPGVSGVEWSRAVPHGGVSEEVAKHFDVVGFDPRGVHDSQPITCGGMADVDAALYGPSAPADSPEWLAESRRIAERFAATCRRESGRIVDHVDTVSVVRDLDMLRAVLGDERLNFVGFSYGTRIGAVYAELFPSRVGRMVLDGAVDLDEDGREMTLGQIAGFDSALRSYIRWCLAQSGCPLSGTVEDGMDQVRALLEAAQAAPLKVGDREMNGTALSNAVMTPLYDEHSWPVLSDVLHAVKAGDPTLALTLADRMYQRDADDPSANSAVANIVVNCSDMPFGSTTDVDSRLAEMSRRSTVFGSYLDIVVFLCDALGITPKQTARVTAEGSRPILVVGTTNDPATPYANSVALAAQLESGHLLTYAGEGHTIYPLSPCVVDVVDAYLLRGAIPADGARCEA